MARYNEILVGRYNRFVQKLLSMKGPANLPTLNPDLAMMLPLFHGAENRYLEGWDIFGFTKTSPAVAAQNASVRLRNPTGSNTTAVLIYASVVSGALAAPVADQPTLSFGRAAVVDDANVDSAAGSALDSRGRPNPTSIISHGGATFGVGIGQLAYPANTSAVFYTVEVPILPGAGVVVQSNIVNSPITVTFLWRERALEDSERA